MNYQPSSHDFVVENPEAKTFFVNREVFVSDDVFEREKRAIFDRCWIYVGPVSYTHLDVYKRQVFLCSAALIISAPAIAGQDAKSIRSEFLGRGPSCLNP